MISNQPDLAAAPKAHIPLVDLHAQYEGIRPEIDRAIQQTIERSAYIGGESLKQFERSFAQFCGVDHAVGVGNGTDALELTLAALNIGANDEVIIPSMTFAATAEAVVSAGATPVIVDVDRRTLNIDPAEVRGALTERTRAIVPVHLYGQPANTAALAELAVKEGLHVIEDAAQAHGAEWDGTRVGGLGIAATFSFYPGKNLGAYGDGGCVVTRNEKLARRVRLLANHGRTGKYEHEVVGRNSRLDGLQAAILDVKLAHLDDWSARRRAIATAYRERLAGKVEIVHEDRNARSVYHLFVIEVDDRARVREQMQTRGISTGIHYPIPLHRQPAFAPYVQRDPAETWTADEAAARILSLPMFPELTGEAIDRICENLIDVLRG